MEKLKNCSVVLTISVDGDDRETVVIPIVGMTRQEVSELSVSQRPWELLLHMKTVEFYQPYIDELEDTTEADLKRLLSGHMELSAINGKTANGYLIIRLPDPSIEDMKDLMGI